MAPPNCTSMRFSSELPARTNKFSDDNLVALRYEQTEQATPPILLPPPRNPLRTRRPCSYAADQQAAALVVTPLSISPQQEGHLLSRSQQRPRSQHVEDWTRDWGTPTSSSATIYEESDDVLVCQRFEPDFQRARVDEADEEGCELEKSVSAEVSAVWTSRHARRRAAPPRAKSRIPARSGSPQTPPRSATTTTTPILPSLGRAALKIDNLNELFTMRKKPGTRKLRKKSLNEAKITPSAPEAHCVPAASGTSLKPAKAPGRGPGSRRKSLDSAPEKVTSGTHPPSPLPLPADLPFLPISTQISADNTFSVFDKMTFSQRGSVMFDGKRAFHRRAADGTSNKTYHLPVSLVAAGDGTVEVEENRQGSLRPEPSVMPSIRVMSADVERESQEVRSLYEPDDGLKGEDEGSGAPTLDERLAPIEDVPSKEKEENLVPAVLISPPSKSDALSRSSQATCLAPSPESLSLRRGSAASQARGQYELAGGVEDWEDVHGADVDRYGFINDKPTSPPRVLSPELRSLPQSTSGRKRQVLVKRPVSATEYMALDPGRMPSRKVSVRSLNTYTSEKSTASRISARSSIRAATNRLPHNRDRRMVEEAGDMLTLQPGLTDITEEGKTGKVADAQKKKELERTEKWRKMAKVIKGKDGSGMEFEFDTKNQKLIERTWKGIPDCWRASAWHSFLLTSARAFGGRETDEQLMVIFRRLQDISSSDDVQIDLDVPRTINRHIMFRKRYRGGQRLLFRVLHAISLYFPDTGYVQGMASLAATLLCYYDEEKCFVIMVRMWKYRGLERLYQPGFAGLMIALKELEQIWMVDKAVAAKLSELAIDATAYGTRWYLTLFNLSIPFPAQLRVWDVFMLLGDCPPEPSRFPAAAPSDTNALPKAPLPSLRGFDVLHATSAALIEALREVLLDSDFENAMKALTSWIPVKDEELLMKVARAEYKQHAAKKRDKV